MKNRMMTSSTFLVALLSLCSFCLFLFSCGDKTGVCTACCGPQGNTYCKDGWTADECKEWSDQKVNGLTWHFHEGQTCAGRGTPATP